MNLRRALDSSVARKWVRQAQFWMTYNRGWERAAYPPLVINVEPTNLCNLRCPFCPVSQNAKNPAVSRGFIQVDLVKRLAGEFAAWKPMIAINLGGESTLHRDLPEIVRLLSDAGCYVFLDTNANLLSPQITDQLVPSGLSEIVFCIDGDGDAPSYAAMRVRGDLDRAIANARYFIERARTSARPIKTIVKNIRYYRPGVPLEVADPLRLRFEGAEPTLFRGSWADYWPGDHAERLAKTYEVEPFERGRYSPCTNLWKKLAISWDGKVFACCLDLNRTVEIGDLRRQSVMEVWNGEGMRAMRRMHREQRQHESDLCRSCTMIQRPPKSRFAGILNLRTERFTPFADRPGRTTGG